MFYPANAAMNKDVMHNKIDSAIYNNTNSRPKSPIKFAYSEKKKRCGDCPERKRKEVVKLKIAFALDVVRLVDTPKNTVHDVLVKESTKNFHADKCQHDDSNIPNNSHHHENLIKIQATGYKQRG